VPVARTFATIWGAGAGSIPEAAMAMWPLYPQSFGTPFSTLLESRGKGDIIHPNVLGHLLIAKAVYAALNGQASSLPLTFVGQSRWTKTGVISRVTATNASGQPREGRLEAYAPSAARIAIPGPVMYSLAPGESVSFEITWPDVRKPEDTLLFPEFLSLGGDFKHLYVVDFSGTGGLPRCVEIPFQIPGDFVPGRQIVEGRRFEVTLKTQAGAETVPVEIPADSQVGRIPLFRTLSSDGKTGYAVTEAVYVEFGEALSGEAEVDGDLCEWDTHRWAPVGEPCQARWWSGPCDNRETPDDAYLRLAFKAGSNGLFIALRGHGELNRDRATLFFDPRPPEQLGMVGPYYWAGMSFAADGVVSLGKGETSTNAPGMTGRWRATKTGLDAELFIPYPLMDTSGWPAAGDLGFSLVWTHQPKDGKPTRLTWSEDGHEWNPRWYGVVRRVETASSPMPFVVRTR
jgi:hypothetical protein